MSQGKDRFHESQWRDSAAERQLEEERAEASAQAGMEMLGGLLLIFFFGLFVWIFG